VASVQPPSPTPAPPVAEVAEPETLAVVAPISPREIARRASGYTVFVRSGAAYGAGVLFDDRGHVLTCNHVLLDADNVEVRFEGAAMGMTARVVERDPDLDLALLAIDGEIPASSTPAMTYGFDGLEAIERGDEVYAMGSPRKMRFSFHRGIVSFIGRPFEQVFFLQTDLAMNPGSSGGPILNDRGQLIGIAAFILRDGQGLSFALPIDYAIRRFQSLTDDSLRDERVATFESWLGRQAAAEHTAGVAGVAKGSPAADRSR
jgi:serine protease Do